MRDIRVSTDVYAAIWSSRLEGEETEDAILLRILGRRGESQGKLRLEHGGDAPSTVVNDLQGSSSGYSEPRFDVYFTEGEEIFRYYKGTRYRAIATKGMLLLLNDKTLHESLNQLNEAIVSGRENAWDAWEVMRGGKTQKVDELRNQKKVRRRPRIDISKLDLSGLDLEL
jgi:hypothetical protein